MDIQKDIAERILNQKSIVAIREFNEAGVHNETIRRMTASGEIIKIAHGYYSSPDFIPNEKYSLLEASKIINRGIICLLSALSYYEIGTQNPSEVWISIQKGSRQSQIKLPYMHIITFSGLSYSEGIETVVIDNENINIYNIPKTIADCFKYRNKIGLDVALEALKDVLENKRAKINDLLHYAEICRVKNVMTPYLESLI